MPRASINVTMSRLSRTNDMFTPAAGDVIDQIDVMSQEYLARSTASPLTSFLVRLGLVVEWPSVVQERTSVWEAKGQGHLYWSVEL